MPSPSIVRAVAGTLAAAAAFAVVAQSPAPAADPEAGRVRATAVCAACHGANGVSVAPSIPNLAGQKAAYLGAQLAAFRDGRRKNEVMAAIAGPLGARDIADVAAYYASLPGAAASASTSAMLPALAAQRMAFPPDFPKGWTHYLSIDFADRNQVRRYWANEAAMQAAREGVPLPDGAALWVEVWSAKLDEQRRPVKAADGHFAADGLLFYTAMERQPGWGAQFPEALRNGDWNYGVFTADKAARAGVNQAECLACHKPLPHDSYLFTLRSLREAASKR